MVVRLFYLGQPKIKVAQEASESDSEAMDTDERGEVRVRIRTSAEQARHLADAHSRLLSNVRDGGDFAGLLDDLDVGLGDELEQGIDKLTSFL